MERAISEMEKIRKAEEIYSRRKNLPSSSGETTNKGKTIYKNLFQILVLFNIAIIIVAVQNKDSIFKEEFITQINSYNINVKKKIEEFFEKNDANTDKEKIEESKPSDANESSDTNEPQEETNDDQNLETSSVEFMNVQSTELQSALVENEEKPQSQMELDIQNIKNNYSIILPLNGVKTSGFGERTSSNKKVTPNHTGVDISAVEGTTIKSAISGVVTDVSSKGDYGKHLRITVDNLTTLYAHCSKIYVSKGDNIIQGQDIAEVGSTRKYDWSTLAF